MDTFMALCITKVKVVNSTVSFSPGNHIVGVVSVRVQSRSTTFVITKGGAKIKHVQPQITKITK